MKHTRHNIYNNNIYTTISTPQYIHHNIYKQLKKKIRILSNYTPPSPHLKKNDSHGFSHSTAQQVVCVCSVL